LLSLKKATGFLEKSAFLSKNKPATMNEGKNL